MSEAERAPAQTALGKTTLALKEAAASGRAPQAGPAAKLAPPSTGRVSLIRRAAAAEFDGWRDRRATLLRAPAGYGKTTLLTQIWRDLESEGVLRLWATLDAREREDGALAQTLLAALRAAGAPAPEGAGLIEALAGADRPVFIALDDYQAGMSAHTDALVRHILKNGPAHVHIAIATRVRPAIGLAALVGRGELTEILTPALSFSRTEARALFSGAIAGQTLETILAKTEGWPAALQLARLWLEKHGPESDVLGFVHGSAEQIRAYLAEEVFDDLDPALQTFLTETAILSVLEPDAADWVADRTDSAQRLAELERLNAFVSVPAPGAGGMRRHPLFEDFLAVRFEQLPVQRRRALRERAATLLARAGRFTEALDQARALDPLAPPLALLEAASSGDLWRFGAHREFGLRLAGMADAAFARAPRLRAVRAYDAFIAGRTDARAEARAAGEALAARAEASPPAARADALADAQVWAGLSAGLFDEILPDGECAALERLAGRTGPPWAARMAGYALAVQRLRNGALSQARTTLRAVLTDPVEAPGGEDGVEQAGLLLSEGVLALADLDLGAAQAALSAAMAVKLADIDRTALAPSAAALGRALRHEAGAPAAAPENDTTLPPLLGGLTTEFALADGRAIAWRVRRAEGLGQALAALEGRRRWALGRGMARLARGLGAEAAILAARDGDGDLAERLCAAAGVGAAPHEPACAAALARIEAARGDFEAGLARLAKVAAPTRRDAVRTHALTGQILAASGSIEAGIDAFALAFELAHGEFAHGTGVAALLETGAESRLLAARYGARLVGADRDHKLLAPLADFVIRARAFENEPPLAPPPREEIALLQALRSEGARADAARALNLSENTAKFYLKRLFQRWEVSDWRVAVVLAERMGFLDG